NAISHVNCDLGRTTTEGPLTTAGSGWLRLLSIDDESQGRPRLRGEASTTTTCTGETPPPGCPALPPLTSTRSLTPFRSDPQTQRAAAQPSFPPWRFVSHVRQWRPE